MNLIRKTTLIFSLLLVLSLFPACSGLTVPFGDLFGSPSLEDTKVEEENLDEEGFTTATDLNKDIDQFNMPADQTIDTASMESKDAEIGDFNASLNDADVPVENKVTPPQIPLTGNDNEVSINDATPDLNTKKPEQGKGSGLTNNTDNTQGSQSSDTQYSPASEPLGIPVTIAKNDIEKILSWSGDGKKAFVIISQASQNETSPINQLEKIKNYLAGFVQLITNAHAQTEENGVNKIKDVRMWEPETNKFSPVSYSGDIEHIDPTPCNSQLGTKSLYESSIKTDKTDNTGKELTATLKVCRNYYDGVETTAAISYIFSETKPKMIVLFSSDDGDHYTYPYRISGDTLSIRDKQTNYLHSFDIIDGDNQIVLESKIERFNLSKDGQYILTKSPDKSYRCHQWDNDLSRYQDSNLDIPADFIFGNLRSINLDLNGDKFLFKKRITPDPSTQDPLLEMSSFYMVNCKTLAIDHLFDAIDKEKNRTDDLYFMTGPDGKFLLNVNKSGTRTIIDTTTGQKRVLVWNPEEYELVISPFDLLIWDKTTPKFYYLDLQDLDLNTIDSFDNLLNDPKTVLLDDKNSPINSKTATQNATFVGLISYTELGRGYFFFLNKYGKDYLAKINQKSTISFTEFVSEEDSASISCSFTLYTGIQGVKNGRFAYYRCPYNKQKGYYHNYLYDVDNGTLYNVSTILNECGYKDYMSAIHDMRILEPIAPTDPASNDQKLSMVVQFFSDPEVFQTNYLELIQVNLTQGSCNDGVVY